MSSEQEEWTMYARFGTSLLASFAAMYLLAFSQLDLFRHFHLSLSVFWISVSMVAAMGLIMLTAMLRMLRKPHVNIALYVGFAALLVLAVAASRYEAFVGDDAFLRSMIPHHSRAIHMCQEATLEDPAVRDLCQQIIETQREEIAIMEDLIDRRD